MNLEQAVLMEKLQTPAKAQPVPKRLTALEMAERVFELAAQAGSPYERVTPRQWARQWLASPEFVLTEVETDKVALLRTPRNQTRVLQEMQASKESMEPLVVDLNKQGLKAPGTGYQPPVIAVDGAHRAYGKYLQGVDTVLAWVGSKAMARTKPQPLVLAQAEKPKKVYTKNTKIASAAILHAAQGMAAPPRQDVGDGGPSPTGGMPTALKSGAPGGADFIKNRGVTAGGPGSGRHASGQDPRGFAPSRKEYRAYDHFNYDPNSHSFSCKGCKENSFTNVDDMYQHLQKEHPKTVQAVGGGTGAGAGSSGTGGAGGATSGANPNFIHGKKVKAGGPGSGRKANAPAQQQPSREEWLQQMQEQTGRVPTVISGKKKLAAARRTPEARSTGQLEEPDPSDTKVPPDPSDTKQSDDPSDRQNYKQEEQVAPPGVRKGSEEVRDKNNPLWQSPGSGVGPRLTPNKGASQSEMQKRIQAAKKKPCKACTMELDAAGKWVKEVTSAYKKAVKSGYVGDLKNVSPPGCEDMVKGLKKSGHEKSSAFAIAWWAHNQGRC